MGAESLVIAIAMLILLAAAAMRFGVDSRRGFAAPEIEQALRGIK